MQINEYLFKDIKVMKFCAHHALSISTDSGNLVK